METIPNPITIKPKILSSKAINNNVVPVNGSGESVFNIPYPSLSRNMAKMLIIKTIIASTLIISTIDENNTVRLCLTSSWKVSLPSG